MRGTQLHDPETQLHGNDRPETVAYPGQGKLVAASQHPLTNDHAPRWVRLTCTGVAFLLVALVAFSGYWAFRIQSNVSTSPLGAGGERTEGPTDIRKDRLQTLILGTDTRDGKNSEFGNAEQSSGYGQSDVIMLLDISADNQNVNVISFPRDLLVDIPSCTDQKTGLHYMARPNAMINSAMAEAGIGCAVDTVNEVTGFEIDHFMMADFNSVKELSNVVGGVEVCVDSPVQDPDSGLRLPKGTSTVQGDQALAFLRTRYAFADGGDLGRIRAQQAFLASLVRKLKEEETLNSVKKVLTMADTITRNLTVDEGLASIPALLTIADRLKDIDPARVNFITVPTVPAVDPNRLQLAEPAASNLFSSLMRSADLSQSATTSGSSSREASESDYDRALQPITVANGTAVSGRTNEISSVLSAEGFTNVTRIAAPPVQETKIYHGHGFSDVAADIAAILDMPAAKIQETTNLHGIQLYLGADFTPESNPSGKASGNPGILAQTGQDERCQTSNPNR